MSTSGLSTPPPRAPKRVPLVAVIGPWVIVFAELIGFYTTRPHDPYGMQFMAYMTFAFVGLGCATVCAWLIQRTTIDPYNDYPQFLDHSYDAGYKKGRCDERNAAPGLVVAPRFRGTGAYVADGGQPEDDGAKSQDSERPADGYTGT